MGICDIVRMSLGETLVCSLALSPVTTLQYKPIQEVTREFPQYEFEMKRRIEKALQGEYKLNEEYTLKVDKGEISITYRKLFGR